jgi:starch phosphorylase
MTLFALRGATRRNAVSQLHGTVSRQMWSGIGIGVHDEPPTVPMGAITNGVHGPTWAGPEMSALFDACLGAAWRVGARHAETWTPLRLVDLERMWQARTGQRARLLARAGQQHLDARQTLVIGFARRFATYKRAGLLLEDRERLIRLMTADPARRLVIVFAGKAHPYDQLGKELVQHIVAASRDPHFGGRLVFVPDYDVDMARLLVQGADVWLNTPRRPYEASGTSGMKAALNGALHVSELDGWWNEAYAPHLGWAIGVGLPADLTESQRDMAEARQLMDLLEQEAVPLYFTRDTVSGLPAEWLMRVNRSIRTLAPLFSAERMVAEYAAQVYAPAAGDRTGMVGEQPGSVQHAGLPSIM